MRSVELLNRNLNKSAYKGGAGPVEGNSARQAKADKQGNKRHCEHHSRHIRSVGINLFLHHHRERACKHLSQEGYYRHYPDKLCVVENIEREFRGIKGSTVVSYIVASFLLLNLDYVK